MNNKQRLLFLVSLFLFACTQEIDPEIAFKRGDYKRSFAIWKVQAGQGDLDAQNFIGTQYLLGLGVDKDLILAKQWYQKAAVSGHPDAQRNLGSMYEAGHGSAPDFEQAFIWFYAAHRQGNRHAGASLEALSSMTKLTPNNQLILKRQAREYIVNEVLGVGDKDY